MAIEELTKDRLGEAQKQLLEAVPATGSIGNTALREKLGWEEGRYWSVRNQLIDEGILEKGRGGGGSVHRIFAGTPVQGNAGARVAEVELYDPILATIRSAWVQDYRSDAAVAETTAHQGRKDTGGKWTRPDITLATYSTYPYFPGKHFDVTTFEIKRHEALDVTVVYEALSHRRAAHYSYVLLYLPDSAKPALQQTLEDLTYEAGQHGVGVVVLSDPDKYETWEVWEEADRNDPDPADVNDFLATQVSQSFKDHITRWFR
jgi:hypothetical protein